MANFNLNKVVKEIDINGENYIATVDIKTISHYKKENKEGFLQATQRMAELDELTILKLLGSIVRKSEVANPVGFNFFKQFNPLAVVETLSPVLIEVIGVNMPEAETEEEKK